MYNTCMTNAIEVRNLRKIYSTGKSTVEAVKDISFDVHSGEIFGILGPNGAGKTTTLEIIECIRTQTSGNVKVLGLDNLTDPQKIQQNIGVQLQSSNYLPALTLTEYLKLFASIYGTKKNPHDLLGFVGLTDKAGEVVKNLSGGQKQRFTIATSLVNDPEIIFLDEPTTGLDPHARRDMWELIKNINSKGTTVVLTTHYMEEAEYLCNRVAIVDGGKILKIDSPKRLIEDLSHTTQVSFLTPAELPSGIWNDFADMIEKTYHHHPKVILEVKSLDIIGEIVEALRKHKIEFSSFMVRTASLEDVYLDLTGREYRPQSN